MKNFVKWSILILFTYLIQNFFILCGLKNNLSFLLAYLFVIKYYFPRENKRNIAPSEVYPLLFFILIGLIDDLIQGILGPAIISKTISGYILINLTNQLFFNWTEHFKAALIFIFTLLDELLYSGIVIYFFNFQAEPLIILKNTITISLFNIPIGLLISWRQP